MENIVHLLNKREVGVNPTRNRFILKEWHRQNPRYIYIRSDSSISPSEILYYAELMYPRANYEVVYGDSEIVDKSKKRKR